jgi:membrane protein insertase Oxa1/YidC/SpoIIIJ
MLIQIPVFIGLYRVIWVIAQNGGIPTDVDWLYSFFYGFGQKYLEA